MRLGFYDVTRRAYDGVRMAVRNTNASTLMTKRLEHLDQAPTKVSQVLLSEQLADEIRRDLAVQ